MKYVSFTVFMVIISISSLAQWRFEKLDNNTLVHFSVGVGAGNAAGIFANTPKQRILFGAVSGTAIGIAKELHDNRKGNQYAQVHDVLATAVGGVVGSMMVNWAIKRNSRHKEKVKYRYKKCRM